MTKHTTTTNNAQELLHDIDSMLAEVEFHQLEPALAYLQEQHIPIYYASGVRSPIDLWTHRKLPLALRRTIRRHRVEITVMMREADSLVCPNPMLHKRYHRRGICQVCKRIEAYLEPVIAADVVSSSVCQEVKA